MSPILIEYTLTPVIKTNRPSSSEYDRLTCCMVGVSVFESPASWPQSNLEKRRGLLGSFRNSDSNCQLTKSSAFKLSIMLIDFASEVVLIMQSQVTKQVIVRGQGYSSFATLFLRGHEAYSVSTGAGITDPHPFRCRMLAGSSLRQPIAPARSQHQLPQ
jgi:hypothetical protein